MYYLPYLSRQEGRIDPWVKEDTPLPLREDVSRSHLTLVPRVRFRIGKGAKQMPQDIRYPNKPRVQP